MESSEADGEGPSLLEQMMAAREAAIMPPKGKKEEVSAAPSQDSSTGKQRVGAAFGSGFKKGFFAAAAATEKKPKKPAIPTISAPVKKGGGAAGHVVLPTRGLVLPEVQSAVDEATPPVVKALQSGEWVTPGLQEKIAGNPALLQKFQDPRYAAFLQEMAKDPKATMLKYKDNAEVQAFMMEMAQVLGDHFTELGGKGGQEPAAQAGGMAIPAVQGPLVEEALRKHKDSSSSSSSTAAKAGREKLTTREEEEEEQAKVDKILSDPAFRSILVDPEMQKVLQDCGQPGGLARHMRDPDIAVKIRKLAEAGLVQLQ